MNFYKIFFMFDLASGPFSQLDYWEGNQQVKDWYKSITTTTGAGCVLISGTNRMLM